MATIKDVAKLSGVSTATVSFVLNGHAEEKKISMETQQKIMDAVKELNYQPNITAKRLRNSDKKQYTVGIYWAFDYRAYSLARLLIGIQDELLKENYPIDIVICPYESDKLHLKKDLFSFNSYNAAIVGTTSPKDMEYLKSHTPPIPIVLFNRELENHNMVGMDNEAAGAKAALHFINKGIKNIGAVIYDKSYLAMDIRDKAFLDTCSEHGAKIPDENIITTDNTIKGGIKAAEEFIKLKNRPKALFCSSDYISHGMVHHFNKNNIKIPQDVEIITVGYNNTEFNIHSGSPILYLDIPIEKMAIESLKLIYNVLEGNVTEPQSVIVDSELILQE